MSGTEILEKQMTEMRTELAEANQTLGALFVLIQCATAEAESANATDAARTLKMASNLALRGHVSGGVGGIVFGRG